MESSLKLVWQRFSGHDSRGKDEVQRIAVLQQAAVRRRAEYAEKKEQADLTGDETLRNMVFVCRRLMEEAESAHMIALQKWENKQSRQKSR